jgi:hypothetical protein
MLIFSSETTGPIATKLWWNDLGRKSEMLDIFLEGDQPWIISAKFG